MKLAKVIAKGSVAAWSKPQLSRPNGYFTGISAFLASSAIVLVAFYFANALEQRSIADKQGIDWAKLLVTQDGRHYYCISVTGYSYEPNQQSIVAFFPAYPLLCRLTASILGINTLWALIVVSNLCSLASCIMFARYCRARWPTDPAISQHAVALFALWPTAFFMKLSYSESLFALVAAIALLGMARDWPPVALALIVGFGTAVRPVGVALSVSFLTYRLCRSSSSWRSLPELISLAPVSCWGLLAYMAYLQDTLGRPLAFAEVQEFWTLGGCTPGFENKALALIAFEPIWGAYDPVSPRYWAKLQPGVPAAINLAFWNPVLFVLAFVLVLIGTLRRRFLPWESILGFMLLLIPYVTRSYEMSMASHARFALIVLPAYLVLASLFARIRPVFAACGYSLLGCWLFAWSTLYALKYMMI